MKVEIVVPCINLWHEYTKGAVDSIIDAMMRAKTHQIDSHLLIVDNASTDVTRFEAIKLDPHLVHYHRNEERWGFQKSVNFGVSYALEQSGVDVIMICNNDIVLHPEAIWRVVERFSKGDVGLVSCMDIRGEMQEKNLLPSLISSVNAIEKESVAESYHPNFSAFVISKELWEIVGEMDELFAPAYFEDNDLHYRIKLAQLNAIVLPSAMFYHYGSRTQNEASERKEPIVAGPAFEKNRDEYVKKWGGKPNEETFTHPYNDEAKSIKATKQNPNL